MLINITGSSHLGLHEVHEACTIIREAAQCDEVQINFGVILNEAMGDSVKITVIATGFQPQNAQPVEVRGPVVPVVRVQAPPEPEPVQEVEYAAAPEEPEPVPPVPAEPILWTWTISTPRRISARVHC